jgi:hypothetical protein
MINHGKDKKTWNASLYIVEEDKCAVERLCGIEGCSVATSCQHDISPVNRAVYGMILVVRPVRSSCSR